MIEITFTTSIIKPLILWMVIRIHFILNEWGVLLICKLKRKKCESYWLIYLLACLINWFVYSFCYRTPVKEIFRRCNFYRLGILKESVTYV